MLFDPAAPASVLVVTAHPDDLEFASGGTIARWVAEGAQVALCVCTSGEKGTRNRDIDPGELAAVRRAEQREAARLLGIEDVEFLGYPDGDLAPSAELRRDLVRAIRRVRPAAVMLPDPTARFDATYVNHPDHCAAGEAALQAVYPVARDRSGDAELLAQGFDPHETPQAFLSSPREPNCVVDVDGTLEIKIRALLAHKSQVEESWARDLVTREAATLGAAHGLRAAETFYAISID